MKGRVFLVLGLVFSVFLASCSYQKAKTGEKAELPPADPVAVFKYISKTNDYHNWDLWPGKGKLYRGRHPHGAFLTTYVNGIALAAIKEGKVMGDGAIIVKENYTPEKKLAAITVMYKVKGYNPAAGDWFWGKYGPDGSVMKAGKVGGCIKCHSVKASNDYIYTGDFVK